ncbi:MAG: hypothetical protein R6W76_09665 [Caldilinea sp.]|jgi:hypothetical protein
MKKDDMTEMDDELRPQYDLRTLLKDGVRGKYVERYRAGTNLVLLDPDVAKAFPDETAVNEALRLVIQLGEIQRRQRLDLTTA